MVNREIKLSDIRESGWNLSEELWNDLSNYEQEFLGHELTGIRTLDNYIARLKFHGFYGMDKVLDAGCGYGQWTLALSLLNKYVQGIDMNQTRINGAVALANQMGRSNVSFKQGSLEAIDFPQDSYDAVFCYSVLMFTDILTVLKQFNRVLIPGGKLYINVDTIGWYLHLLFDVPKDRIGAIKMIVKTLLGYKRGIMIREKWLRKQLNRCGFTILSVGNEGETSISPNPSVDSIPFYSTKYYGQPGILEVIAMKNH